MDINKVELINEIKSLNHYVTDKYTNDKYDPQQKIAEIKQQRKLELEKGFIQLASTLGVNEALKSQVRKIVKNTIPENRQNATRKLIEENYKRLDRYESKTKIYNDAIFTYLKNGQKSDGGKILDDLCKKYKSTPKKILERMNISKSEEDLVLDKVDYAKLSQHVQTAGMMPDIIKARLDMDYTKVSYAASMKVLSTTLKQYAAKIEYDPVGMQPLKTLNDNISASMKGRLRTEDAQPYLVEKVGERKEEAVGMNVSLEKFTKTFDNMLVESKKTLPDVGESLEDVGMKGSKR